MDTMISSDNIKDKFITEAIEHANALSEGDYTKANELHKKLHSLYNKAKGSNQADIFSELLTESDENVRLWAAIFTLKVIPEDAEKTLENLSNSTSITGLSAATTLELWKKGMLELL